MTIRIGGPSSPFVQTPTVGGVSGATFASRLASVPTASSSGVSGRQVVATALGNSASPRSTAGMAATVAGGTSTEDAGRQSMLDMIDKVKMVLLTNAIFDAGNAPVVEKDS